MTQRTPILVPSADCVPSAVPHLLGFEPDSSFVILGLSGSRRTVAVSMRCDLPDTDEVDRDGWAHLMDGLARAGADQVLLAVYPHPGDEPWRPGDVRDLPYRLLLSRMVETTRDAGVEVLDAVCVVGSRFRSYLCDDDSCCPPEGRVPDASEELRLRAAFVETGSAPLPSRRALVEALDARAPGDRLRDDVRRARDGILVRQPAGADARVSAFLEDTGLWGARPASLTTLARLVVVAGILVWDIRSRDLLMHRVTCGDDRPLLPAVRSVLSEAVRCSDDPQETAALAATLAVCCWVAGDGAAARVAVDRAFAADPAYSLTALVEGALDAAIPPWSWVESMSELTEEQILGVEPLPTRRPGPVGRCG